MPDTYARAAIPLERSFDHPCNHPAGAHAAWQSHIESGRIGNPAPADPATIANRLATARLFARLRMGAAA